jgi:2-methylisocitrate lyase-like PEP mutase family enzyme
MRKTVALRELIRGDGAVMAPCCFDALSAKIIEHVGFKLAGTTGAGMHGVMLGMPDNGLMCFNEALEALGKICDAVSIPIIADAEGGYGNAINTIRTVRSYEKAGLAGLFIEDQKLPPNCPFLKETQLIGVDEMVGKIRAAADTREDPDFVIVARTDAPYEQAIERANIYAEAGADMIKIIPRTREQLENLPKLVKAPLHLGFAPGKNINDGLTAWDAGVLGYKIITFPMTPFNSVVRTEVEVLRNLFESGTDEGMLAKMYSYEEYFKIVGADELRKLEGKYLKE